MAQSGPKEQEQKTLEIQQAMTNKRHIMHKIQAYLNTFSAIDRMPADQSLSLPGPGSSQKSPVRLS
jgi:hypothetical protein